MVSDHEAHVQYPHVVMIKEEKTCETMGRTFIQIRQTKCKICDEIFADKKSYKAHFVTAHAIHRHCCSEEFVSDQNEEEVSMSEVAYCPEFEGDVSFISEIKEEFEESSNDDQNDDDWSSKEHQKTEPQHVCTQCDKRFKRKHDLTKHYENVHDERLPAMRKCHICNQTFSNEKYLQTHIRVIHKEKTFKCDVHLNKRWEYCWIDLLTFL